MHVTAGSEFVVRIMVHDLRRLREYCDQVVVTTPGDGLLPVRAEGFRMVTVPMSRKLDPFADVVAVRQLTALMREERPDVVHTYAPKAGLLGQIARRLAGVRIGIHGCRGLLYEPGMPAWRRHLFRMTDTLTNVLADRTLYLSTADRAFSIEQGLCAAQKAVLIGSGVDSAIFSRARVTTQEISGLRNGWGISAATNVVLTVGRYVWDKGYGDIVAAMPKILAARPDTHFVWVAPVLQGEEGVVPSDYLAEKGLERHVTVLGLRDDMPAIYAASTLLLHPSHREGVPRAVMEAAMMELPVVASDIPGCREIIESPDLGLLFSPFDADALARSVVEALTCSERTAVRAAHARTVVHERFDQNALTDRVWKEYQALLS